MKRIRIRWFLLLFLPFTGMSQGPDDWVPTDSVPVPASTRYSDPSLVTRIFLGKNYRKEWETPVLLPVFDMKAMHLKIEELGGGMQTKSLELEDANGEEWVLRTVDKFAEGAVPEKFRNKLTVGVVQQMISAAYPYAPLTISTMAKATGVHATEPRFFIVPDDEAFGQYRETFANQVCMLERKNVLPGKASPEKTPELIESLLKSNNFIVDQEAYLRARLLDMLIGDWDRHPDQWKWAIRDSAGKKVYVALPRDRDQAFFQSGGLLVTLVRPFAMKHLVGFKPRTSKVKNLNRKSWNQDKLFMNQLDEADWKLITEKFRNDLTDDVIRTAVKNLPPEIYAISGEKITGILISRKEKLPEDAMDYYRFISNSIVIEGTDDAEIFAFSGNGDSLTVTVNRKKDNSLVYRRSFHKNDTKEIRIQGLGGEDSFVGKENLNTKIDLKIDGGDGDDLFSLQSIANTHIVDSEANAGSYTKELQKFVGVKEE